MVCIPLELLNCILANLQGAHLGIDRMQAQAREAMYWLGIDANIADYEIINNSLEHSYDRKRESASSGS